MACETHLLTQYLSTQECVHEYKKGVLWDKTFP